MTAPTLDRAGVVRRLSGQDVRVYRNVTRDCWSVQVRSGSGWRVAAHCQEIVLTDARLVVREAGRQRVLRERRKNVHAWIIGRVDHQWAAPQGATPVGYNPYRGPSFVAGRDCHPVHRADLVWLLEEGRVRAEGAKEEVTA